MQAVECRPQRAGRASRAAMSGALIPSEIVYVQFIRNVAPRTAYARSASLVFIAWCRG